MIVVMTIILRLLIGILFRAKLISREYRYSHRLIFFFCLGSNSERFSFASAFCHWQAALTNVMPITLVGILIIQIYQQHHRPR